MDHGSSKFIQPLSNIKSATKESKVDEDMSLLLNLEQQMSSKHVNDLSTKQNSSFSLKNSGNVKQKTGIFAMM
jgi:hypothetical protein